MKDYYEVLGVNSNSSSQDIKRAFFKLVRQYSPEKYPEEYENIRKAYEVLIDEKSRAEYDAQFKYGEIIEQHIINADEYMEKEDYKSAIREYKKILSIEPTLEFAKNRLGLALMYDGQLDEALKQFIELNDLNSENPTYSNNLAYILLLIWL